MHVREQRREPARDRRAEASMPPRRPAGAPPVVVQRQTVAEIIGASVSGPAVAPAVVALAAALGAAPLSLVNALLDPAYDVQGAHNLGTLNADLADPLSYASCYPTAEHLFPVLAQGGQPVAQGANLDAYPTGAALRAQVEALVGQMIAATGSGAAGVYRIEFAGHGFTLIGRAAANDGTFRFELLESLAHSASLVDSIQAHTTFTPAAVYANLRGMASDDLNARVAAAANMGWNAHMLFLGQDPKNGGHVDFPAVRLKWWATNLAPNWAAQWGAQFQTRFNFLAQTAGIPNRI